MFNDIDFSKLFVKKIEDSISATQNYLYDDLVSLANNDPKTAASPCPPSPPPIGLRYRRPYKCPNIENFEAL